MGLETKSSIKRECAEIYSVQFKVKDGDDNIPLGADTTQSHAPCVIIIYPIGA